MDVIRNQADELVREARLKAIEREHRSKGSILDTRELYKIVDPPYDETMRRSLGKRNGRVTAMAAAAAAEETAESAANQDKKVAFTVKVDGDFKLEEQMWRTKSVENESIQKRRYENAELHKFRENMTPQQKIVFREKVMQAVRDLAMKYREEMGNLKIELDRQGIFHPTANAHRVHCMYLMKLHKGFSVDSIEVPVLCSLKAEELMKERHDAYEEDKRTRLIKLATEGKTSESMMAGKLLDTSPIIESEVFESKEKKKYRQPLTEAKASQHSELADKVREYKDSLRPVEDEKEKLLTMLIPNRVKLKKLQSTTSGSRKTMSATTKSSSPIKLPPMGDEAIQTTGRSKSQPLTRSKSAAAASTHTVGGLSANKGRAAAGQSGFTESPELGVNNTIDETGELVDGLASEGGSVGSNSKLGDKSLAHSKSASSAVAAPDRLMFMKMKRSKLGASDPRALLLEEASRLEQSEVHNIRKVKERSEVLDEQISNWMINNMQTSQIGKLSDGSAFLPSDYEQMGEDNEEGFFGGFSPQRLNSRSLRSPQTVVPFDDFFAMFSKHIEGLENKTAAASSWNASPEGGKEKERSKDRKGGTLTDGGDLYTGELQKMATMTSFDMGRPDDVKKVDIVQVLGKKDPDFKTFVEHHGKAKPMSEIIARSNAKQPQPRRIRVITPLGRDAVVLKDSGGKPLKHSSRGFINHFKGIVLEGLDETINIHQDEASEHSSVTPMASVDGTDDQSSVTSVKRVDSLDMHAHFEVEENRQQTSRQTSRNTSRREARSRAGRSGKGLTEVAGKEQDMQAKLVATWQTIELSSHMKLSFMQKYSTDPYSVELGRATDLWAEAAVFIVARVQTLKLANKFQLGYCVMPVNVEELIYAFTSHIHPLLSSTSPGLIPQSLHQMLAQSNGVDQHFPSRPESRAESRGGPTPSDDASAISSALHLHNRKEATRRRSFTKESTPQLKPLSSSAVDYVLAAIHGAFSSCDGVATTEEMAKTCISTAGKAIDALLSKSLKRTQDELEDTVYFGDTICREWMGTNTLW